ncbi:MAG: biotin/lipoyl-binding protein, partial [Terriglobales bacterium]
MTRVPKLLVLFSLLPVLILPGCTDRPGPGQESQGSGAISRPQATAAVPVTVAKVARTTIPVELHAIGTGQAFKTVSVESQVAGIVKEVHYQQGQFVHQGDLL